MRKLIAAILGTVMFAALARGAEDPLPHVTVYGTATTQVVPDQMVWHLTIQNKAAKLPSVAEQHVKTVGQVLSFLKRAGIKDGEVQTARMEFGANWEYRSSSRVQDGYFASTAVSFRTSDLDTYQPVWIGLAEIPGVSVDGVAYDHSKRINYQNDTRRSALLKAREKASELAKTLGAEIGEPLVIEEDLSVNEGWQAVSMVQNRVVAPVPDPDAAAARTELAPGRIPIRIRVKVSFRLIGQGK